MRLKASNRLTGSTLRGVGTKQARKCGRSRHTPLTTASPPALRPFAKMAGLGRSIAIAPFRDHGSVKHRAKEILAGSYLRGFNDLAVSKCFCNVSIWPEAYSPAASLILDAFLYSAISF